MLFRKVYLSFLFMFFSAQCYALHMAGVEIFYKHISGNKYEITVYYYSDCIFTNPTFLAHNVQVIPACNTDTISAQMTKIEQVDITPIPGLCNDSSLCKGGIPYGLYKFSFKCVVVLPNNCCEFTIRTPSYYSMKNATTFYNHQSIVGEVNINRCYTSSSPVFEVKPEFFLRLNQPQHLSFKCIDTSNYEFTTYELFPPIVNGYQPVIYYSGFSYKKPFTVIAGNTTTRKAFPKGFFFDTLTGEMTFQPALSNQVTMTAVKAFKWKEVNDTLRKVSESLRQFICEIIPTGNNLPSFKSFENELVLCPDTGLHWFEIPISDADSIDTLHLSYKHKLGNKIQISDSGSHNNKVVKVGYRVDSNTLKNNVPDLLTISAADSACPLNGVNRKTFKFIVKPYLQDSFAITKSLKCRLLELEVTNNSSVSKPNIKWVIASTKDTIIRSQPTTLFNLPDTGWYKIQLEVGSDEHCSKRLYYDSIYSSQAAFLEMQAPADTSLCFNPTVNLQPTVINGTAPIKYNWSTGDTTPIITVSATAQVNQYWVSVADTNNCSVAQDTVNIFYYNPKVSLSGDIETCIGDTIQLQATLSDTTKPTFGWIGFNSSTQLSDNPTDNKTYTFSLTDFAGCKIDTTWSVKVYNPKIQFTHNTEVCRGDSLTFSAQADSGTTPYLYNWVTLNKTGQNATIATKGLSLGFTNATLLVTDSFGCTVTGATRAFVKPKPTVSTSSIAPKCIASGLISLISYGTPTGGFWVGKGVDSASSNLNPQLSDTGVHPLVYIYTNNLNCSDSSSTTIIIEPSNFADFIANKTTAEEGDTITFTNTSIAKDINNSKWDFGNPSSGTLNTFTGKETSHIYNDSGLYTVQLIVTGGVCPDDTLIKVDYITINKKPTISVREINKGLLKLYPNPAKDKLTIEADNPLAEIVLVDVLGKSYKIENLPQSTKAEINIAHLAAGVYILEAKDVEGNVYTSKVQISR